MNNDLQPGQWITYHGKRRRAYYKDGGFCYVEHAMGKIVRVENTRVLLQLEVTSGVVRIWVPLSEISVKQ